MGVREDSGVPAGDSELGVRGASVFYRPSGADILSGGCVQDERALWMRGSSGGLSGNNSVHGDVVRFGEGVPDDLERVTDADLEGVGAGVGQRAVVVAAPASEAAAVAIKGETGAEEGVDFLKRDLRRTGWGFEDVEGPGSEKSSGVKGELSALDPGVEPADVGVANDGGR